MEQACRGLTGGQDLLTVGWRVCSKLILRHQLSLVGLSVKGSEGGVDVNGTETMRVKVILALLTALLAFIGAVGGTLATSLLERSQWERQTGYEYQQGVFKTRLELIERTAEHTNKADIARIYDVGTQGALSDAKASIEDPDKFNQATNEVADYTV